MAQTWTELKAQGVRRCCATTVKSRCRKRAADGSSYCVKHAWVGEAVAHYTRGAEEATR